MFAVGHLAFGYLTGRGTAKFLKVDVNIPLLFLTSILPDVDLLIPSLQHRGPTHSLIVYALIFLPFFMLYGKRSIVYFVSLSQHVLLGDLLTFGGVQVLWPLTSNLYSAGIRLTSLLNVYFEWTVFLLSLMLMLRERDVHRLFQHHPSNLLLTMPVFSIILPIFLSFPLAVPFELFVPHAVYLVLLAVSILTDVKSVLKNVLRVMSSD